MMHHYDGLTSSVKMLWYGSYLGSLLEQVISLEMATGRSTSTRRGNDHADNRKLEDIVDLQLWII